MEITRRQVIKAFVGTLAIRALELIDGEPASVFDELGIRSLVVVVRAPDLEDAIEVVDFRFDAEYRAVAVVSVNRAALWSGLSLEDDSGRDWRTKDGRVWSTRDKSGDTLSLVWDLTETDGFGA